MPIDQCCGLCFHYKQREENSEYGYCGVMDTFHPAPCWYAGKVLRCDAGDKCLAFRDKRKAAPATAPAQAPAQSNDDGGLF